MILNVFENRLRAGLV